MKTESRRATDTTASAHRIQFGHFGKELEDPGYIFGISEIDAQHEEIETILISLQNTIDDNDSWHDIHTALNDLREKLTFHFTLEEAVMHMFFRPDIRDHCRAHAEIIERVEGCMKSNVAAAESKSSIRRQVQLARNQIHSHDSAFIRDLNFLRGQLLVSRDTDVMQLNG
jgi:hemerythrin-like metal-binding protein